MEMEMELQFWDGKKWQGVDGSIFIMEVMEPEMDQKWNIWK